jgi:3-polyprenyl-4-hydroxybenzoate decarboxylase
MNVDLNTVITGATGVPALVTLLNELRAALVAVNLIKGSA